MSGVAATRDIEAPAAATRTRLKPKTLALGVALLAVCGASAWYAHDWWTNGRFIETTDDAYVGGDVTTISPHVAGFVATILVTDNEHVKAGQLLATLDGRDYQAALDRAKASVDARMAALANLKAQTILQQSTIRQAAADLVAKTARAAFTRIDGARYATLATTAAGSRQDAQKTLAADQEAQAASVASQAGVEIARQQLKVLEAQTDEAQALLAAAQSDLRRARLDVGYTEIRSPIDGYVGNRALRIGEYVTGGSYLLSIIPAHGLWIDANFKEDQLSRMAPGQAASTIADVAPGQTFHGRVLSLAPGTGAVFSVIPPENATGNFTKIVQRVPVRIALDPSDATLSRLRPGLSTTVSVDTRTGR